MSTVEQVSREVLASVPSEAGILLAAQWIDSRYKRICARSKRNRHLRQVGELTYPAPITTGLVTATQGSNVVTGDATAQAAWGPQVIGRHIRIAVVWQEIIGFENNTLKLRSPYSENSVIAGAYHIVQRWTPVDPTARSLGDTIIHVRLRYPLENISPFSMDQLSAERLLVGPPPAYWCEVDQVPNPNTDPKTQSIVRRIELYPYSSITELLYYVFYRAPDTLRLQDQVPPNIDNHVLKEGALIDAYRYEAGKAAKKGDVNSAGFWRNESRKKKTNKKKIIKDAFRYDSSVDDKTFILERLGALRIGGDIKNAYSEVFARGSRP